MKTPEIGSLVTGILAILGLAIALGQYSRVEIWARNQAMEAMAWKQGLPYFFASPSSVSHKAKKEAHRRKNQSTIDRVDRR